MKQDWLCEQCLKDGTVTIPLHADVWGVIDAIYRGHAKKSPQCPQNRNKIRVRNAELMSKAEWREQRRKLRFDTFLGRGEKP